MAIPQQSLAREIDRSLLCEGFKFCISCKTVKTARDGLDGLDGLHEGYPMAMKKFSQAIELKPLSEKEKERRKPLPPESLVEALSDRVHKDVGRARAARLAPRVKTDKN